MTISLIYSVAIIAVANPVLASGNQKVMLLKPSSAWNVNYAKDGCTLGRQFGEGDDRVLVVLNRYGPGDGFGMTVSGKSMKVSDINGIAKVQFGPSEVVQSLDYAPGNLGKLPTFVFNGGIRIAPLSSAELKLREKGFGKRSTKTYASTEPEKIDGARLTAVKYIEFGRPLNHVVRLETGSMRSPLAALDKCTDELTTHWGIDYEKHKNLRQKARPVNNPGEWVTQNDYPPKMLQSGQPANIAFRLDIGADGKPTGCYIQAATHPKEFDSAVCGSILNRARFSPAMDAQGNSINSYYLGRVNFRLPE